MLRACWRHSSQMQPPSCTCSMPLKSPGAAHTLKFARQAGIRINAVCLLATFKVTTAS